MVWLCRLELQSPARLDFHFVLWVVMLILFRAHVVDVRIQTTVRQWKRLAGIGYWEVFRSKPASQKTGDWETAARGKGTLQEVTCFYTFLKLVELNHQLSVWSYSMFETNPSGRGSEREMIHVCNVRNDLTCKFEKHMAKQKTNK